jgi:hypothetical protein
MTTHRLLLGKLKSATKFPQLRFLPDFLFLPNAILALSLYTACFVHRVDRTISVTSRIPPRIDLEARIATVQFFWGGETDLQLTFVEGG